VSGVSLFQDLNNVNFRRIFYINLPLCVPSIAGIYFFMNLKSELQSVRERLRQVDWTGMLILTASLISLLYGVTSDGVLQPWDSAVVIFTIVIGTCGITCFLLYEAYFAKEPMIPLRIFSSRTAGAAYISSFILGFVLWAMQYYLILYVRSVYDYVCTSAETFHTVPGCTKSILTCIRNIHSARDSIRAFDSDRRWINHH